MALRIQLDEHLDTAIARQLRRRGVDAVTAAESGLIATPDHIILNHAHVHSRAVLTYDADYLRLHHTGQHHSGIIYCTPTVREVGQIVELVHLLSAIEDQDAFMNHLEYL